jgi:hypothetical protein
MLQQAIAHLQSYSNLVKETCLRIIFVAIYKTHTHTHTHTSFILDLPEAMSKIISGVHTRAGCHQRQRPSLPVFDDDLKIGF